MENNEIDVVERQQLSELLTTVSSLLERISKSHDKLNNDHGENKSQLAAFDVNLKEAKDSIAKVIKVLHEGNGEKPLITRTAVLEEKVQDQEGDIEKLYDRVESIKQSHEQRSKGHREMIAATISAIAAIVAAVMAGT